MKIPYLDESQLRFEVGLRKLANRGRISAVGVHLTQSDERLAMLGVDGSQGDLRGADGSSGRRRRPTLWRLVVHKVLADVGEGPSILWLIRVDLEAVLT